MEAAAQSHNYHRNASPIANHIGAKTESARTSAHVAFAMRLRPDITKTKTIVNNKISRFQDFCLNAVPKHMATTESNREPVKEENIKIKEEEQKSKKMLPPPPEKPEPGDCCGSGCVRCVWDVYYEELEAYDKLYKCDSNDSKSNFDWLVCRFLFLFFIFVMRFCSWLDNNLSFGHDYSLCIVCTSNSMVMNSYL